MTEDELVSEFTEIRGAEGSFRVWVMQIHWDGPHTPRGDWLLFGPAVRTMEPAERLRRRAVASDRLFGNCRMCGERNPQKMDDPVGRVQQLRRVNLESLMTAPGMTASSQ